MRYTLLTIFAIAALSLGWFLSSFTHSKSNNIKYELAIESNQNVDTNQHDFVRVYDIILEAETDYQGIDFGFDYTSFIIEILNHQPVKNVKFTDSEGNVTLLNGSSNADLDGDRELTSFVIPNSKQQSMNLYSGSLNGKVRIYLFYAPPIEPIHKNRLLKAEDSCSKPDMILGSVWREGLPTPIGTRSPSTVNHNIIHHAASSNSNHDYMNVVRNIYLLHTQSNGWDDIGYNFLIAQDGSVFEGRDPLGTSDIDDTKGAHFCAKNSGTMGICILGNYMETSPTTKTIESLQQLILWKCVKSSISPIAALPHPDANSPKLNCVAGHRDGCATACPGDSLYRLLPAMRQNIYQKWLDCGGIASKVVSNSPKVKIRVNSINGQLKIDAPDCIWDQADIYDLSGKKLGSYGRDQWIPAPANGRYVVRLYQNKLAKATSQFEIYE